MWSEFYFVLQHARREDGGGSFKKYMDEQEMHLGRRIQFLVNVLCINYILDTNTLYSVYYSICCTAEGCGSSSSYSSMGPPSSMVGSLFQLIIRIVKCFRDSFSYMIEQRDISILLNQGTSCTERNGLQWRTQNSTNESCSHSIV